MAVADVDLDMDDLFGDGGRDVDDLADQEMQQPELVDGEAGEEGATQDGKEEETDLAVLERLKKLGGAAKKRVLKPQPKLDATRLQSTRGLSALKTTFANVKFKGKGHEREDLVKMMGILEHWAHRLFPKMPFDDFTERLERLGKQRSVQTTIKRIRLGMDLDDEVVRNEPEDEVGNTNNENNVDNDVMDAEEAYEEMIRQEREEEEAVRRATQAREEDKSPPGSPTRPAPTNPKPSTLTDEQRERMERNRRLALERRMKRMGVTPGKSPNTCNASEASTLNNGTTTTPGTSTPSLGAQMPTDEDLVRELMEELEPQHSAQNRPEDAESETLRLKLTETAEEKTNTEQLDLHLTASDNANRHQSEDIGNDTSTTQDSEQLNLVLSESEVEKTTPGKD